MCQLPMVSFVDKICTCKYLVFVRSYMQSLLQGFKPMTYNIRSGPVTESIEQPE